jgi:hypothetical protein
MSTQRRFVNSTRDEPLTAEEEYAILRDPEFWKGWQEHVDQCRANEKANKLKTPVVFPLNHRI